LRGLHEKRTVDRFSFCIAQPCEILRLLQPSRSELEREGSEFVKSSNQNA
jgi:hypothetical protein